MKRLVFTKYEGSIVCVLFDGNLPVEINIESAQRPGLLGNIYTGKVKDVKKNINAAFVDIGMEKNCYYSLEDNSFPIYTHGSEKEFPVSGDEIIVQISKEAVKTKPPALSSTLKFSGRYVLIETGKNSFGVSHKIDDENRKRLSELFSPLRLENTSVIIRTNAKDARDEEIYAEIRHFNNIITEELPRWKTRKACSVLMKNEPYYIGVLREFSAEDFDEIVTDDTEILSEIEDFMLEYFPLDKDKLKYYADKTFSLSNLYGIKSTLTGALAKKVWLKSGAYLVIEMTEALCVIDINTGKKISSKDKESNILEVNKEAAYEIIRQLRLRNISGMIIADFIDMKSEESKEELLSYLKNLASADKTGVKIHGFTTLGLVEMTRKKVRMSLYEQYKNAYNEINQKSG